MSVLRPRSALIPAPESAMVTETGMSWLSRMNAVAHLLSKTLIVSEPSMETIGVRFLGSLLASLLHAFRESSAAAATVKTPRALTLFRVSLEFMNRIFLKREAS